MKMISGRIATFLVAIVLAGCGGGGEEVPVPVPTVTVVCPNGAPSTAATLVAANAACPVASVASVVPANGTLVSPDSFQGITAMIDSLLDATSLTAVNIKLTVNGVSLPGTVSAVGTKGFNFVPTTKLQYGLPNPAYAFAATVKDSLGRTIQVNSTFGTARISCTAPLVSNDAGTLCGPPTCPQVSQVWTMGLNACVYQKGTQIIGAGQVSLGCNAWADQICKDDIASGKIKFAATPMTKNGRPLVYAYLRNNTTLFGVTGLWNVLPIYADDGSLAGSDISGGSAQEIDWILAGLGFIEEHIKPAGTCVAIDAAGVTTPQTFCSF